MKIRVPAYRFECRHPACNERGKDFSLLTIQEHIALHMMQDNKADALRKVHYAFECVACNIQFVTKFYAISHVQMKKNVRHEIRQLYPQCSSIDSTHTSRYSKFLEVYMTGYTKVKTIMKEVDFGAAPEPLISFDDNDNNNFCRNDFDNSFHGGRSPIRSPAYGGRTPIYGSRSPARPTSGGDRTPYGARSPARTMNTSINSPAHYMHDPRREPPDMFSVFSGDNRYSEETESRYPPRGNQRYAPPKTSANAEICNPRSFNKQSGHVFFPTPPPNFKSNFNNDNRGRKGMNKRSFPENGPAFNHNNRKNMRNNNFGGNNKENRNSFSRSRSNSSEVQVIDTITRNTSAPNQNRNDRRSFSRSRSNSPDLRQLSRNNCRNQANSSFSSAPIPSSSPPSAFNNRSDRRSFSKSRSNSPDLRQPSRNPGKTNNSYSSPAPPAPSIPPPKRNNRRSYSRSRSNSPVLSAPSATVNYSNNISRKEFNQNPPGNFDKKNTFERKVDVQNDRRSYSRSPER